MGKVIHNQRKCPYQYWTLGNKPKHTKDPKKVTCKWCKSKIRETNNG